ncbi:iron-containing alcohol dehydrogenase [uncultured Desulfosarcina sp.]|uniref:iron-containing alcohol dehydrogenase n=1 Tax=uncultured Desulfosarcina sp. TaxID=218289 RepID=UPI0029C741E3|nr:iron-containing alcohol dehydrogenase [uncultured Desulfosarcina sp.]
MNESQTFPHFSPGKLFVGPGSSADLVREIPGNPVYLVVTDRGLSQAGMAARLTRILEQEGRRFHVFDNVVSDPPMEVVASAFETAKQNECSAVLALGGGSSLDAAKAVAVRMKHDVSLRDYGNGRLVKGPIAPLYAIPTTAGTGSEATRVAVITDVEKKEKMAIRGDHLTPLACALDPDMIVGIPARIAAETGADALTHAIEAFVSRNANSITDALALAAIEKIGLHLRRFAQDTTNAAAALEMLVASCLAGQAFTNAGLGLVHSIGEVLGSRYHTSHGLSCALYLPATMAFNLPAVPEKFTQIARALGEDVKDLAPEEAGNRAVGAVRKLFVDLKIPLTYAEAGIDFSLTPKMVDDVLPQFSTSCNPRKVDADEVAALFNAPMG